MKKKLVMIVFLMAALNACTSSRKAPVSSSTLFKQIGGIQTIDRVKAKLKCPLFSKVKMSAFNNSIF
jgi:hypothetical protein